MSEPTAHLAAIAAATARDRLLIAARKGEPKAQPADQMAALLDLAKALDDAGIPYALIGGIAVGIHAGAPRATDDVNVAVPTSIARRDISSALTAAGFTVTGEFEHSLNLRHEDGEPVQVAFDLPFDDAVGRAETIDVGGRTVRLVTKEDLIEMKERAGSDPARRKSKALRDRADVELLRGDVAGPDEGW